MSTLSLRIPDSLHERIRKLAQQDGVSINQFISTAAAEKVAALLTVEYLQTRADKGDKSLYLAALAKVPDVPPVPGDEMES
jgi:uncharacterized protein (DUF1778 family)